MSINPSPGTSSPTSTTPGSPIDAIGLLGNLTGLPFDANTVINGLLANDQVPITNLQTQIKNIQTNESIFKSLSADVANLQSQAFNFTLQSVSQANAATSSNPTAVSASASPLAQAGSYTVAVNQLATSTAAKSTTSIGQAIDSTASALPLSGLNLNGTPTAGTFSVVVDGRVQTISVDLTKPVLDAPGTIPPQGALSRLEAAIGSGLSDGAAAVSVGVSGNKVTINITGASASHTISFGAAGDSSNFLSVMNLSTAQGTTAAGALSLASSGSVGITRMTSPLTNAALATSLAGTPDPSSGAPTGAFSVNGVSISWNAHKDALSDIVSRINNSSAGVNAQFNSVTDQLILVNRNTGQTAINLADTSGNLLAAMHLAPGTTQAQTLGVNASISVNGTTVTSTSNTFTNAAPGLSITASSLTGATQATLTVGPDVSGITKNIQSFVDAANKVLNGINLTQQKDATSGKFSQLLGDPTLTGIINNVITTITGQVTGSGSLRSLQDIGITTGAVGSLPGTTLSLSLNTTKLAAALAASPGQVAALFNGTQAANGFQGAAQKLNTYLTRLTNVSTGSFAQFQSSGDAQIKTLQGQVTFLTNAIAARRQSLVTQFTAMNSALTNLSSQSSLFTSLSNAATTTTTSGH